MLRLVWVRLVWVRSFWVKLVWVQLFWVQLSWVGPFRATRRFYRASITPVLARAT
ncbi:hypothetical protein GCM10009563_23900 [Subtercola frigoramans]